MCLLCERNIHIKHFVLPLICSGGAGWLCFTQGDMTQIFPTISNPIQLNLNFYINADPKSTYKSNIYQSQILPPGPHFEITLIYVTNFRSKFFFYKTNIEDGKKVHWKKRYFNYNLHFLTTTTKKNLQKIWDFLGFLKFRDLVAKSEIGI